MRFLYAFLRVNGRTTAPIHFEDGTSVSCPATSCHLPSLLTHTSVKRYRPLRSVVLYRPLSVSCPVTTAIPPKLCTFTSRISIESNFTLPDRRFVSSSDLWVTDPSAFVKIRSSASICSSALQSLRSSTWLNSTSRAVNSLAYRCSALQVTTLFQEVRMQLQ